MDTDSHVDPIMGSLTSDDGYLWEGSVTLPGFGHGRWDETLDVSLYGEDDGFDPALAAMLHPLVTRATTLADLVLDAIWAELQGRETENGHWWARPGGLESANETLDPPIVTRDDLWRVLRPHALFVRADTQGDGQLTTGINFHCDFEEEHGLDVLTDGTVVLGTGYALDAEKYARHQRPA